MNNKRNLEVNFDCPNKKICLDNISECSEIDDEFDNVKVVKRDLTTEKFDIEKIKKVIALACEVIKHRDVSSEIIDDILFEIKKVLLKSYDNFYRIHIEYIQDVIERTFVKYNYYELVREFIIYREKRTDHRKNNGISIKNRGLYSPPWGPLGYITYKRTYARILNEESDKTEEFDDTVMRVLDACQNQLKVNFTKSELELAYEYFMKFKGSVAGRFLWQLGTKTVEKLGLPSLQNCAGCILDNIDNFCWLMDLLLLGVGVGYSVEKRYISQLPKIVNKNIIIEHKETNDAEYIVGDSREHWVKLLKKILTSYFFTGESFTYSTILVRPAGKPIKGFGGISSGPEPLIKGMKDICNILNKRKNQQVTSVDCLDICCIIATIVVAGNIRRCLSENALVHTKEGLIKIKDIEVDQEVLTSNGYKKVLNVFEQGKQMLCTIITQDSEFECTPNHKMAVLTGINNGKPIYKWKEAQNLTSDDYLINPRNSIEGIDTELPTWCYDKPKHSTTCKDIIIPEFDEDLAWLIGMFHGDGYTYPNYDGNGFNAYVSIVVGIDEYEIGERVKKQLERFGEDLHITLKKRKNENSFMVHCMSKQLAWYFDKNIKQANIPIKIPEFILKAKKDIKLAYISGILDSDGCANNKPVNIMSSVYLDWTKQVQVLAYSCGIETRINIQKKDVQSRQGNGKTWQYIHKLNLITNNSKNILSQCPQLVKKLKMSKIVQKSNHIPIKMFNISPSIKRKIGAQNKHIIIDRYEQLIGELEFCPVKVKEVLFNTREDNTYDIEVEDNHEFFCNGYLTHNSATISIGDVDDIPYVMAKRWDLGNVPNHRAMVNMSVNCNDISKLPKEFWDSYESGSECIGLLNMDLCKQIGRLKDGDKYPDPDVKIFNPCLTKDTMIDTIDGLKRIDELIGKEFIAYVNNIPCKSTNKGFWYSGHKEVYKITLEDGKSIKATDNHKFLVYYSDDKVEWTEVKNLKNGLNLALNDYNAIHGITYIYSKIKNIKYHGVEDVYDCTIPDIHCFSANGIISHNCSEQNLANFETCCVSFDTKIQTKKGVYKIGDLLNEDIEIWNGEKWSKVTPFLAGKDKILYRVHLSDGSYLDCTDDHGWHVKTKSEKSYKRVETKNLTNKKYRSIEFNITEDIIGINDKYAYEYGFFSGDGYIDNKYPMIYLCGEKNKLRDKISGTLYKEQIVATHKDPKIRINLKDILDFDICKYINNKYNDLHDYIMSFDKKSIKQFIAGIIDSDGNVCRQVNTDNYRIFGNEKKIRDIQILLRRIGINHASVYKTNSKGEKTNKGIRNYDLYCCLIPSYECADIPTKLKQAIRIGNKFRDGKDMSRKQTIIKVEKLDGLHDTFCFTEPDKHMGVFGNVLTYQCLAEIYLPNLNSFEEAKNIAMILYRICKHSLLLPCHLKQTEDIVHKNLRMGIGITGYCSSTDEQKSWLSDLYEYLRNYDKRYSKMLGVNTSVKITTCKPSGTLSLLPDSISPGVHPGLFKYYIRRIRISTGNKLIDLCRSHGYKVEYQKNYDKTDDLTTMVVEFPCKYSDNTVLAKDVTAIRQLEMVKELQTNWSDNSVSNTIYFRPNELNDIKNWLKLNYNSCTKSVSFLPQYEHNFTQMPYEEITKEEYEVLMENTTPITSGNFNLEMDYSGECANGVCPIR